MATNREKAIAVKCQLLVGSFDGGEDLVCDCPSPNGCYLDEEVRNELRTNPRVLARKRELFETYQGTTKMKVYIAGPMRGIPNLNFPAFDEAKKRWEDAGHWVITPADMDREVGVDGSDESLKLLTPEFLREAILKDVEVISNMDAVAVLHGWDNSLGSAVEVAISQFFNLPIYDAETMLVMDIPNKPWSYVLYEKPNRIMGFLDL